MKKALDIIVILLLFSFSGFSQGTEVGNISTQNITVKGEMKTTNVKKPWTFPNLQYNSTATTYYWKFADGQRFFTLRDDTSSKVSNGTYTGINIFLGRNSGNLTNTGGNNIGMGDSSLTSITSGSQNVAIGYKTLTYNTSASNNTAIGSLALKNNTTGASNTAIGRNSMNSNTTGSFNCGLGQETMYSQTTGSSNIAIGYQSGYTNTVGGNNISIGVSALRTNNGGYGNVAIGYGALRTTAGYGNTAIGDSAGRATTGNYGVFIGYRAGLNATNGNEFYLNNVGHSSNANEKLYSLLYGSFSGVADSKTGQQLTINGTLIVSTSTTPASAGATGVAGTIAWDASYVYVCTATNTWKRVAIATW